MDKSRITNREQDSIISMILEPRRQGIRALEESIRLTIDGMVKAVLPTCIKDVRMELGGESERLSQSYVSIGLMEDDSGLRYNLNRVRGSTSDDFKRVKSLSAFQRVESSLKDWQSKTDELVELKSQLSCAVSKIRSPKKMKLEFPEGYKALCGLRNMTETPCDSMESHGAKLNTK